MTKRLTRPVCCLICGRRMHYSTHPEHEPEIEINLKSSGVEDRFYTHITCWDNLLQPLNEPFFAES